MIKKAVLLSAIVALPLATMARSPIRTGQDLDERLMRKAQRISRAVDRNIDYMSRGDKQDALELISQALRIIRGKGGGGGHGGAIVKFNVEQSGFILESNGSLSALKQACVSEVSRGHSGSADNIDVEVNGQKERQYTSGWWRSAEAKCQVVVSLAAKAAAKAGTPLSYKQYVLQGIVDGQGIAAEGNSLSELQYSCEELTKIEGSVDDMKVSMNGGPIKTKYTSGWWRSSAEVCRTAINLVF